MGYGVSCIPTIVITKQVRSGLLFLLSEENMDWEQLKRECYNCRKCSLWETRHNVVFGVGNEHADVMFIGEGPGEQEDLQGEPFVGRAGQLLDDMLKIIYLDRHRDIYIANIVKCRPPRNRDPLNMEQDACIDWLERQIELVDPRLIVCLGRIAAMRLIKPDFRITKEHGQWFDRNGRKIMALYHPAALLRDPRRRPETFEDLKEIERAIKALR